MRKIDEAIEILCALGLPRAQQNERSGLTLLALANIGPKCTWPEVQQPRLRILDIMAFMRKAYRKKYAPNSRETIRRQTIHQFEQARIVDRNADDPMRPTNSGLNVYSLTDAVMPVLASYGTANFERQVMAFIKRFGELDRTYSKMRKLRMIPLALPNKSKLSLSPGKHNALQVAIVREFGPRFAPGALVYYLGDTSRKHVVCETELLLELGISITQHDKLPDIVLYDEPRRWLYMIEAVTSHGPVNPKRFAEIEEMLNRCTIERVYVTAFLNRQDFRKYAADIAWETEVWIADSPDHMIHFNGPKFLGPYKAIGD